MHLSQNGNSFPDHCCHKFANDSHKKIVDDCNMSKDRGIPGTVG